MLSVIIVNYKVKYFLEQCLFSVLKAGRHLEMEVIVIDNCSGDGSCEYLEPLFPGVTFYRNKENLGFGRACNLGVEHSKGGVVLFLNPDTIVAEDCFDKCLQFLNSHDEAGALGVRMVNEAGLYLKESKRGFPSPFVSFFKFSGLTGLFPRSPSLAKYYLGNLDEYKTDEAEVIAGAFMMIKKKVLDITGGFDELFFMYGEDIDLSYRIQQKGFKNFYFPEVTLLHFKGRSTPEKDISYVKMFYGAMDVFTAKYYRKQGRELLFWLLRTAIVIRAAFSLLVFEMAGLLTRLIGRFNSTKPPQNPHILLVSGKGEDCGRVLLFINRTGEKNTSQLGIEPGNQYAVANAASIEQQLLNHPASHLVFCEGSLTFKEIIGLIALVQPRGVKVGLHANGSAGISWGVLPDT